MSVAWLLLWGLMAPEVVPAEVVPAEIVPRAISEQRADTILLDSVVRENRWFLQSHLGGSFFDARRNIVLGRWTLGLTGGYRFARWGLFGAVEWDETIEFTTGVDRLDLLNVGVGVEYLNFLGHVRSSLTVGTSILLTDTVIDEAGEVGWSIDLRPGALRWAVGRDWVLEFTPFGLDIMVPVTSGIPLVIYGYTTSIGGEWSIP